MNIIKVIEKDYGVFINSPNGFLAMSDFTVGNGINAVDNVNIIKSKDDIDKSGSLAGDDRLYIAQETESVNFFKEFYNKTTIYTFLSNDVVIEDFTDKLQVANSSKGFEDAKIDISHVIYVDKVFTKKDLLKLYKKVSGTRAKYLGSLNLPLHISNILNTNDFLAVMCNVPKGDEPAYDKLDFDELEIEEAIETSVDEAFEKMGLKFGILDYLVSEGILIGDLIDTAVELIEGEIPADFRQKMEDQLLNTFADINVITLLVAATRTANDLAGNRIREINISDDFDRIHSDVVFGLAIANQIGGTNAVFNFRRYSAAKPGILAYMPPILDDLFAGLIAGCVSKVLDD